MTQRIYTPSTEQVLYAYQSEGDGGIAGNPDHSKEGFYRWLNAQKAGAYSAGWHAAKECENG